MTPEDFDALFDRFHRTVVRFEAGHAYSVGGAEQDRIDAWRRGDPRPERSVRTSPWLARVARTTVTDGKQWRRLRVVDTPLTEYQRYQLEGYIESQAAGDEVRLLPRHRLGWPRLDDFWLFDSGTDDATAVFMHYTDDGELEDIELVNDDATLQSMAGLVENAWPAAARLNTFLAGAERD